MKTRTSKAFGAVAGIAAIALSIPLAVNAYADPPAQPTEIQNPYPDLQGSGCDAFKAAVPNYKAMANLPVGQVLAGIPDVSTFNAALSGGFNPAVNVIPVLENGPYVVFAPTDQAFGALDPAQLEALKADPAALFDFDYYHAFLGLLGVDDVHGQRPTQQGAEIMVDGKGGDIKVNGAKVLCGAIQASNARIYLIDTVLDKSEAPEPVTPSGTSTTSTTTTTTSTSATPEPLPAADAPIG